MSASPSRSASTAKDVVARLISKGSVERGWLGVQIQPVSKDIAESLGLAKAEGALVADPQADGPAKAAGIAAGDVITAVDGKTVDSPRELARMIANMNPGTKTDVTIWRNGAAKTLSVKLGELPGATQEAKADTNAPASADVLDSFGLTVTPAEDGNGLVVTDVDPNGDAAERGIQAGDVIVSVNSTAVNSAADMQKAVKTASDAGRKAVLLQVQRDSKSQFIALPVSEG